MSVVLLALCLSLAWFVVVNAVLSLAVAAVIKAVRRRAGAAQHAWGGNPLLAVRLLPAIAAAAFVVAVFLPAFLAFESQDRVEPVSRALLVLVLGASALTAATLRRGLALRRQAADLVDGWLAHATPMELAASPLETYAIDDPFPVMSLVGVRRPRLFIARQVLEALSARELALAVAHEVGHRTAWDNLKRQVLCWTPDLLGFLPAGHRLDREWALAAECEADFAAMQDAPLRGLDLAGALIKVSRLASQPAPAACLFSALHEGGDVTLRVSLLVDGPGHARQSARTGAWRARTILASAAAATTVAALPYAWPIVHGATEALIRLLA